MKPKPMLLIELDGAKENLKLQSNLIEKWLQQEALEFRKAGNEEEAEKLWRLEGRGLLP